MKRKSSLAGGLIVGLLALALAGSLLFQFDQSRETERKLGKALLDIERLTAAWNQWQMEQGTGRGPAPDLKELNLYLHKPGTRFIFPLDQFLTGKIGFSKLWNSTSYKVYPAYPTEQDPFGNSYFTGTLSKSPALHPATYSIALGSKEPARFLKYAP